jgi:hypothetical protein
MPPPVIVTVQDQVLLAHVWPSLADHLISQPPSDPPAGPCWPPVPAAVPPWPLAGTQTGGGHSAHHLPQRPPPLLALAPEGVQKMQQVTLSFNHTEGPHVDEDIGPAAAVAAPAAAQTAGQVSTAEAAWRDGPAVLGVSNVLSFLPSCVLTEMPHACSNLPSARRQRDGNWSSWLALLVLGCASAAEGSPP